MVLPMFNSVKALTFDTGGTILDWHSGFRDAFRRAGEQHDLRMDWAELANTLRRESIMRMRDEANRPQNFDSAHTLALTDIVANRSLPFTDTEIRQIAYDSVHSFKCWPDFPDALEKLRTRFLCVPLTILSYRIVLDTARENGLNWDAVLSCEGLGYYKPNPEVYRIAARYLQLDPSEVCMVAAHNFDLDAARSVGFRTVYVKRPEEWGTQSPPDAQPNPECDLIVDGFEELVSKFEI